MDPDQLATSSLLAAAAVLTLLAVARTCWCRRTCAGAAVYSASGDSVEHSGNLIFGAFQC
ncbi:hypothetical protein PF005_g4852 [Phytophthora fragariae]|uniref:Uncharacterized protein n=1 Tax=Phytophthora fragariae TaxID=53985 RepID=A0A6A3UJ48_9STRA|nr:hypothetical protein PF003_g23422 [Phytophthora fragariae]KAE8945170.1 hypothetical protein PF009_g5159 [Phytophthora fragariae]KAE9023197.1 hypothetical protein PF011_g4097 [Phytophthora fragariae]KAE9129305.1 hypothetical protein PF007_g4939 [Phytophthora fragariae]KAE9151522.1 hypothetical protein PF006_g4189 [Phytophthora fragariae]